MEEKTQFDLASYMSGSIARIMAKAYRNVLSNPREARFAYRMQRLFQKSEKRRSKIKAEEGHSAKMAEAIGQTVGARPDTVASPPHHRAGGCALSWLRSDTWQD